MKKISVIIPCYNAEKSINPCLNSIVNQTIGIDNLEIILVNDASTDNTLQILVDWESNYPEIILVVDCKENGKQGAARNIGMQYASGDYIAFADDDDILEPDMYETMYHYATKTQSDLVVCGSKKEYVYTPADNSHIVPSSIIHMRIDTEEKRLEVLNNYYNIAIWNKLYSRSVLLENNIFFPHGYIYDDIYFTGILMQCISSICILPHIFYHHIISESSASYHASPSEKIGFIEVHIMLLEELIKRGFYTKQKKWFDEQFIIDYLTFYSNYEKCFGPIPIEIKTVLNKTITSLLPDIKEFPIVNFILNSSEKLYYKQILNDLIN